MRLTKMENRREERIPPRKILATKPTGFDLKIFPPTRGKIFDID